MAERRAHDDVRERIDRFLADSGMAAREPKVVPLTGDASDRRYFRVLTPGEPSQVLAVHPGPIAFNTLPFVNVCKLLSEMPVPVPAILGHSDPLGIIALQDLGDVTLQAHLGAASAAEHAALYRQAVTFIETLQRRGRELQSGDYLPYGIAFDVEKLTWELQFFVKHFLEAYRGAALTAASREALAGELALVAEELAAEPRVLCHRDYHSRNLMLHEGNLHIIDFQDARMGPDTYDLVSLLRDSYVDFTDQQVEELIAFFLALRQGQHEHDPNRVRATGPPWHEPSQVRAADDEFRRRFDLMALQRNLKALGTFGFQTTSRGNTVYIQYIPRTLNYARANLARYERFGRLQELLAEHVEELR
jgi:N-acetylmuramate 1-kinase